MLHQQLVIFTAPVEAVDLGRLYILLEGSSRFVLALYFSPSFGFSATNVNKKTGDLAL